MSAKYVLGVNTLQANRDHDYGDGVANQLRPSITSAFSANRCRRKSRNCRSSWTSSRDAKAELMARAAILFARELQPLSSWGGGNAEFQLLFSLPLAETGTVKVKANHGNFDLKDARATLAASRRNR